jgi:CheY-like chemotaxis protein
MPSSKIILVVDDEKNTRELLREILLGEGYQVVEAEDGEKALEIIQKQKIDLIITDRSMPVLGGLELLQRLKRDRKSIPSLMISAYGEEELWGAAIGQGARDYILKPFKAQDVLNVVRKVFSGGAK